MAAPRGGFDQLSPYPGCARAGGDIEVDQLATLVAEPGKETVLPPPPPLRTGLDPFRVIRLKHLLPLGVSYRTGLAVRGFRGRWGRTVRRVGDLLRISGGTAAAPSFEIRAPLGIKGICVPANEDVPPDWQGGRRKQTDFPLRTIGTLFSPSEHPLSTGAGRKVLLLDPASTFVRVPSYGPAPQRFPDLMVHVRKDSTTDHSPVIVRPTSYPRVQHPYQCSRRDRGVLLDELPDTFQKGEDPFLGRLDEHRTPVFAYRRAQEVKARVHMPDDRLFR